VTVAWTDQRPRAALRRMSDAAVASAPPEAAVMRYLPAKPKGRCIVVGAGKASAAMAKAFDTAWPDIELSGVVVTRYGHAVSAGRIRVIEAAHPVPDANGESSARAIIEAVRGLGKDDLVVALISGGGSALMTLPAGEMTSADKQAVNKALLLSGATIGEMNAVRKHLSNKKGGRLAAAAYPAHVVTLVISDVQGDDPAVVASGPTVPDESALADVNEIVTRFGIELPASAKAVLAAGREKPAEISADVQVIAAPSLVLAAVANEARRMELTPLILGDAIEGESRELGIVMAGIARSVSRHGLPARAPAVLLSGGRPPSALRAHAPVAADVTPNSCLALPSPLQANQISGPSPVTATGQRMRRAQSYVWTRCAAPARQGSTHAAFWPIMTVTV
jgi:glycerate 2-kinase